MTSKAYRDLRAALQPGLADPDDAPLVVREKMHAIHPTDYPDDVEVERCELGGVPAAWVNTPESEPGQRGVIMVHGGAFVSSGIEHYIPYAASLSRLFAEPVLIFEYRLAPEHPFPAALDDSLAVYRALLAENWDAANLAMIGDSCGGSIALATLMALRDAGDPLPAAYAGLTPWFDLSASGDAAANPRGVDPYVNAEWIRKRGQDYAGDDLQNPLVSPLFGQLHGLPPLFLSTGEFDTCRDDATRLATRAGADGAAVTLEIVPEMIHGFHGLNALAPECRDACQRIGDFLQRCWHS